MSTPVLYLADDDHCHFPGSQRELRIQRYLQDLVLILHTTHIPAGHRWEKVSVVSPGDI